MLTATVCGSHVLFRYVNILLSDGQFAISGIFKNLFNDPTNHYLICFRILSSLVWYRKSHLDRLFIMKLLQHKHA